MAIQSTAIGTVSTTLYTSVGDNAVTNIMFCNTIPYNPAFPNSGLANLTVYLVKSGDSPTTTNMVVNFMPIPAGETFSFDNEKIILGNNDSIRAVSDQPATLVATVSSLPV